MADACMYEYTILAIVKSTVVAIHSQVWLMMHVSHSQVNCPINIKQVLTVVSS